MCMGNACGASGSYLLAKIDEKYRDEMEASGPVEVWQVGKLIYITCFGVTALCLLQGLN